MLYMFKNMNKLKGKRQFLKLAICSVPNVFSYTIPSSMETTMNFVDFMWKEDDGSWISKCWKIESQSFKVQL